MGSEAVGQARWSQGPSRKQTLPLSRAGVGGQGLELPPPVTTVAWGPGTCGQAAAKRTGQAAGGGGGRNRNRGPDL